MRLARILFILAMLTAACAAPPTTASPTAVTAPLPAATSTRAVAATPTSGLPAAAPSATRSATLPPPTATTAPVSGTFVKEEVNVTGSFTLDLETNTLHFSDDFAIPPGPDLFVLLSGASDLTTNYLNFSQSVTNSPQLSLGKLQRQVGGQEYAIPSGTDFSPYHTVVILCQSFSVAFAAAPLALPLY